MNTINLHLTASIERPRNANLLTDFRKNIEIRRIPIFYIRANCNKTKLNFAIINKCENQLTIDVGCLERHAITIESFYLIGVIKVHSVMQIIAVCMQREC